MNLEQDNKIDFFLEYLSTTFKSKNTIKNYYLDIKFFLKDLRNNDINMIDHEYLSKWLEEQKINNRSNVSINRSISAVKSFFKFLEIKFNISNSSILNLKLLRTSKNLPKNIRENDLEKIATFLKNRKNKKEWENNRDYLIFKLIFITGMRISEALSLKLQDFLNEDELVMIKGKGLKERMVPISKLIKDQIIKLYYNEYPLFLNKTDHMVFLNTKGKKITPRHFQRTIKYAREKIGSWENFTPHSIRHSCATYLLEKNINIKKIQKLLGHKNLSTTQIYTKVNIKNIIEKLNRKLSKN